MERLFPPSPLLAERVHQVALEVAVHSIADEKESVTVPPSLPTALLVGEEMTISGLALSLEQERASISAVNTNNILFIVQCVNNFIHKKTCKHPFMTASNHFCLQAILHTCRPLCYRPFSRLTTSQSTIPAETETLRECLVPNCGISHT